MKTKKKQYFPRVVTVVSTSSKVFLDKKTKAKNDRRVLNRVEY